MIRSNAEHVVAEMEASRPAGSGVVGGLSPLSETLWRGKTDVELVGDVSARLTWKDLSVTAMLGNGETKAVLAGLTGYAEPGTLTAIMGTSGSGKSTLLDVLAGRLAANTFLSGTVLLNGCETQMSFGTVVSSSRTVPNPGRSLLVCALVSVLRTRSRNPLHMLHAAIRFRSCCCII